jgi:hypothetical protein
MLVIYHAMIEWTGTYNIHLSAAYSALNKSMHKPLPSRAMSERVTYQTLHTYTDDITREKKQGTSPEDGRAVGPYDGQVLRESLDAFDKFLWASRFSFTKCENRKFPSSSPTSKFILSWIQNFRRS